MTNKQQQKLNNEDNLKQNLEVVNNELLIIKDFIENDLKENPYNLIICKNDIIRRLNNSMDLLNKWY